MHLQELWKSLRDELSDVENSEVDLDKPQDLNPVGI
jgi:predicted nucleotidyltransferase